MKSIFPKPVLSIIQKIQEQGFDPYIVGGAVRDLLLNQKTNDWDFTTNATPEELQKIFPDSFYDNVFGTVGVAGKYIESADDPEEVFEITTFRSDGIYTDHRRPEQVSWGKTIDDDLKRRDFTVNAMAIKILHVLGEQQAEFKLVDPFHGQQDLEQKTLRAVGNPDARFQEDALRMMRAIRQGAQLGFSIEAETLSAITRNTGLIQHISWERIRDEFLKILVSPFPEQGLQLLDSTGILKYILPELLEGKGLDQRGHHIYDVWNHTLKAVSACPSKDPIVRFATLLHDIAKPRTATPGKENGETINTFYNHEVMGAYMAKEIAQRFRLSKRDIQRVFTLVRWHMFVYDKHVTDAYIRRFIRRVGKENINDIMDLREADRVGSGATKTSWRLEEMKQRIGEQFNQPFSLNDLAIDGNDIMTELNLSPGPQIGAILKALFEEVLEDPEKNTKEYLLEKAKKLKESMS